MARLYKTASATPLDYMYRINSPLMERVVAANDQFITQNLQQADVLENAASSFSYLQPDEARAKAITESYSKKIDEITKAIRNDPANWRKHVDPIRNVSRDLQQNFKVGEISKIAGNYGQYKKVADYIDKQVEEYNKSGKGISADRAKAYKEYFLNQFTSKDPKGTNYNPNTGEYNAMQTFDPMGNIDIKKMLGEELDKIKADKTRYKKSEVTGQEWYFNDKTQSWEGVTPEKILSIVTDRMNNPQLMQYLQQDSQVGLIKGVFDDQGRFIAPYSYNGMQMSPEEQGTINNIKAQIAKVKDPNKKAQLQSQLGTYEQQLKSRTELAWNPESYLSPILRGLVSQYSYSQTDNEDTLRNNSKGSTQYVQQQNNARNAANIASREKIAADREAGINQRFKERMDWEKFKYDNPQDKTKSTGTGKGTGKGKEESTVSNLSTNSFEDWTMTDPNTGQTHKVLSNAGLSADIGRLRDEEANTSKEINKLNGDMKNLLGNRKVSDLPVAQQISYNKLLVQKQELEQKLPKIQSDLRARRAWYGASVDAALTNNPAALKDADGDATKPLTAEEIALYNKYKDDRDFSKTQEQITQWGKKKGTAYDGHALYMATIPEKEWGRLGYDTPQKVAGLKDKIAKNNIARQEEEKIKALRDKEKEQYFSVKKKVDQMRENFLAGIRYTPIDTDAIQVGDKDSKILADMIFSNPQGLKIYDNTGNKAESIGSLDGKGVNFFGIKNRGGKHDGDNYNMTFTGNNPDLIAYMQKHNVTPVIEQVGNTTKIGTGNAVVKVTFKDPNGEIPTTPFYIEVTPELQKQIGVKFGQSKDAGVQKIANALLDEEANEIRRQLITPTVQRTAGKTGIDPVTTMVFIRNGNTKLPLQVTKFVDENGTEHLNITAPKDGVQVPLGANDPTPDKRFTPQSGIPGWFNGAEDFINYIKRQRQYHGKSN